VVVSLRGCSVENENDYEYDNEAEYEYDHEHEDARASNSTVRQPANAVWQATG